MFSQDRCLKQDIIMISQHSHGQPRKSRSMSAVPRPPSSTSSTGHSVGPAVIAAELAFQHAQNQRPIPSYAGTIPAAATMSQQYSGYGVPGSWTETASPMQTAHEFAEPSSYRKLRKSKSIFGISRSKSLVLGSGEHLRRRSMRILTKRTPENREEESQREGGGRSLPARFGRTLRALMGRSRPRADSMPTQQLAASRIYYGEYERSSSHDSRPTSQQQWVDTSVDRSRVTSWADSSVANGCPTPTFDRLPIIAEDAPTMPGIWTQASRESLHQVTPTVVPIRVSSMTADDSSLKRPLQETGSRFFPTQTRIDEDRRPSPYRQKMGHLRSSQQHSFFVSAQGIADAHGSDTAEVTSHCVERNDECPQGKDGWGRRSDSLSEGGSSVYSQPTDPICQPHAEISEADLDFHERLERQNHFIAAQIKARLLEFDSSPTSGLVQDRATFSSMGNRLSSIEEAASPQCTAPLQRSSRSPVQSAYATKLPKTPFDPSYKENRPQFRSRDQDHRSSARVLKVATTDDRSSGGTLRSPTFL